MAGKGSPSLSSDKGFIKYIRGNIGNLALCLLLAYSGLLLLVEVRNRMQKREGNDVTSTISTLDDVRDKGGDHDADSTNDNSQTKCRPSVYDWGREDRKHAKVLSDRKEFFKLLQIGGHRKEGLVSIENPQTLILHAFQPSMSCADLQRYGGVADGGKVLCEAQRLLRSSTNPEEECVVYSFGVGYDCKFEMDLLNDFPSCTIHMFDPSVAMERFIKSHCWQSQVHFYPWGLRGEAVLVNGDVAPPKPRKSKTKPVESPMAPLLRNKTGFYTLPRIMSELGHTGIKLHLLKMDIEGGEFDSLLYLLAPQNKKLMFDVNLFLMELHNAPPGYQEKLMSELEANDMRLYYAERNAYYPKSLIELAMLNSTALRLLDTGQATGEF